MVSRRRFIQQVAIGTAALKMRKPLSLFKGNEEKRFSYQSPYLKLEMYRDRPAFSFFSTDNLGGSRFPGSPLLTTQAPGAGNWRSEAGTDRIDYYSRTQAHNNFPDTRLALSRIHISFGPTAQDGGLISDFEMRCPGSPGGRNLIRKSEDWK